MKRLWSTVFLILTFIGISAASQEEVDSLVRKLGSDVIEEREKATRALIKVGHAARPALLQAVNHKDGEVARRARSILDELEAHVDLALPFFNRALSEEGDSPQRLLRRTQLWATRVLEGKSWTGVPESFDRQGIAFELLIDFGEDQNRTSYRYLLKKDAVKLGDARLSAWITVDVGREVESGSPTKTWIGSAKVSLGLEIKEDHKTLLADGRLKRVEALNHALVEPYFAEVAVEFPFVRSVEMTYGPLYRWRREEYPTGVEVRFELGSPGAIRSSSFRCELISGLDPVRNAKGESVETPFTPTDSLRVDAASGGGSSGPAGHGMKRMDLPAVRDPFHYMGHSNRFYHAVHTVQDFAALPASATRVRVRVNDCSADHLRLLGRLKHLSFLDLSDCPIDDDEAKVVSGLTSLDELWLSAKALTDRGLRSLASLKELTSLYVEEAPNLSNDSLDVLGALPKLTYVGLSGWGRLTDDGMKHVGSRAELTRLYLSSIKQLTDDGIAHIGGLKRLEKADFGWLPNLTHRSAAVLAELPELRDLWFTAGNVDDAWMVELGKIKKLQFLMAHQCRKVTDSGLLNLKDLKDLRRLNVDDKATEAGMKALKALLPGNYITY